MSNTSQPRGRVRPRLLSLNVVAEELGVCVKTIRRQIKSGTLIAHRIGRSVRVAEDDLERFRSRQRG